MVNDRDDGTDGVVNGSDDGAEGAAEATGAENGMTPDAAPDDAGSSRTADALALDNDRLRERNHVLARDPSRASTWFLPPRLAPIPI